MKLGPQLYVIDVGTREYDQNKVFSFATLVVSEQTQTLMEQSISECVSLGSSIHLEMRRMD